MVDAIKVEGLREFNKALKALDKDLPKLLRLSLNDSVDLIVQGAQRKIVRKSGRAARSIKAASTRTKARVRAGGGRVDYYPWLDFGGRVGRNNSIRREFKKKGRYIYPTYFKARDSGEFVDLMEKNLADVARRSGLEVT